jgi:hypothetical protein
VRYYLREEQCIRRRTSQLGYLKVCWVGSRRTRFRSPNGSDLQILQGHWSQTESQYLPLQVVREHGQSGAAPVTTRSRCWKEASLAIFYGRDHDGLPCRTTGGSENLDLGWRSSCTSSSSKSCLTKGCVGNARAVEVAGETSVASPELSIPVGGARHAAVAML